MNRPRFICCKMPTKKAREFSPIIKCFLIGNMPFSHDYICTCEPCNVSDTVPDIVDRETDDEVVEDD